MSQRARVAVRRKANIGEDPYCYTQASLDIIERHLGDTLDLLGNVANLVRGKRVLVKLNLVRPNVSRPAATTDPRVTVALVRLLRDAGAKKITVGENPGQGVAALGAFIDSGTDKALEGLDVEYCYFDQDEKIPTRIPNPFVLESAGVPRTLLETDFFINLPKMKTHLQALVSLGIKNLHGCIPDEERNFFHRNDISYKVVDLFRLARPHLTILDGLWAMEGQAPFYGRPLPDMGTFVAGEDTVAVDAVGGMIMGIRPEEVMTTMLAASEGLGIADLERIDVLGDSIESVVRPFQRPVLSSAGRFPKIRNLDGGVCTGCLSALRHSLDRMELEGKMESLPQTTVYTGIPMPFKAPPESSMSGKLVLFGNCALTLAYNQANREQRATLLPGCPPYIMDFHDTVTRAVPQEG